MHLEGSNPSPPAKLSSSSQVRTPGFHPGNTGSNPVESTIFYFLAIVNNVETVAELAILAMSMFLAAFFCLKVLFIPDSAMKAIDKIYEVEEEIYQER